MNGQRAVKRAVQVAVALLLLLALGTACHEMIGHGLTGVLLGGRITYVEVLGLELVELAGFASQDTSGLCLSHGNRKIRSTLRPFAPVPATSMSM